MAILVGKFKKKSHLSGTNGLIWLKIKMGQYLQISLWPQGMVLCSKHKGSQDFGYLKHLGGGNLDTVCLKSDLVCDMVCWYGPHISTMILPPCGWYGATSSTRGAGSSARGLDQYRVLHFAKVHLFFCPQAFSGSFWWEASENAIKFAKIGGAPSPLNVNYTACIIARSPILLKAKFST